MRLNITPNSYGPVKMKSILDELEKKIQINDERREKKTEKIDVKNFLHHWLIGTKQVERLSEGETFKKETVFLSFFQIDALNGSGFFRKSKVSGGRKGCSARESVNCAFLYICGRFLRLLAGKSLEPFALVGAAGDMNRSPFGKTGNSVVAQTEEKRIFQINPQTNKEN